jgi:PTH1 family peptidyl-tRNA hydrolase
VATVVVGLGNPGPAYQDTRHNVGQRVVERLAEDLGACWRQDGPALVARGRWRDEPLYLVKPLAFMNLTGPSVAAVLERSGARPGDLLLVHDDIDLPLGAVRVRLKGGHGGHNGVRSVIETLGTEEVRRVKIGVGRPEHRDGVADHVLAAFQPDELPVVDQAIAVALERVQALLCPPPRPEERSESSGRRSESPGETP